MDIEILAIGKFRRPDPNKEIFDEYTKRIPWKIKILEIDGSKNLLSKEAQSIFILNKIEKSRVIIALDERGKEFTSQDFAKKMTNYRDNSQNNISFLIGGAEGHSKIIHQKADLLLSFGKMTWPHMMVRAMLAEQIYRAYSIIIGHPYHK